MRYFNVFFEPVHKILHLLLHNVNKVYLFHSFSFLFLYFIFIVYKSFSQETNSFPNPQRALNIFSSNKSPFNYSNNNQNFFLFISHILYCILWAFFFYSTHITHISVLVTIKKRFSNIRDVISFVQLPIQPPNKGLTVVFGDKKHIVMRYQDKWMG